MAVEPKDDELLHDAPMDGDENDVGLLENDEEHGSNEPGDEGGEELELTFGDEVAPASGERDTGLVKHLREEIRRRDLELAEARKHQTPPQKIEVGERPTLEGCDYDEEKHAAEVEAWVKRREEAARLESETEKASREANEAWQNEVRNYEAKKAELKFPDTQDAVEVATSSLSQVQQAVIVKAADNPALVFYSLGKHPAKLAEIASIKDPLKQAAAVAKLEGTLKVTTRRKAPAPEEIASGSARVSQGVDKTLERLEAEAVRTGDRTKIVQYKQQRAQAKT